MSSIIIYTTTADLDRLSIPSLIYTDTIAHNTTAIITYFENNTTKLSVSPISIMRLSKAGLSFNKIMLSILIPHLLYTNVEYSCIFQLDQPFFVRISLI